MAKILVTPDCGNAPRKLFLKNFHEAIANGKADVLIMLLPDTIKFSLVGEDEVQGKQNVLKSIKASPLWKVKELKVDTIITHGPDASVSGEVIGQHKQRTAFSIVYRFKSAGGMELRSISCFIIVINQE